MKYKKVRSDRSVSCRIHQGILTLLDNYLCSIKTTRNKFIKELIIEKMDQLNLLEVR